MLKRNLGLLAPILGVTAIEGGLLYTGALKVDGWEAGLLAFAFMWTVIMCVIGSVIPKD